MILGKLRLYGVKEENMSFFRSYFSQRSQYVSVGGVASVSLPISSGFIQGSITGPIIFLLCMNDIVILGDNNGTVVIYIYADDTCIRLSLGEDPIANQNKIDATMALIQNYMDSHKLKSNFRKTEFVLVSPKNIQKHRDLVLRMNGQVVKQKKSARLLGLYITWDMGHEHYLCQMRDNTLEWLGRHLSVLSMLAKTTSYGNLKLLAYGLIYSKVIFGLQFWADCPKRLLDRLQILLNRAARIVMKKGIRDIHVNDLYRCLKWIKLTASSATMICYFISASELLSNLEASAGLYMITKEGE